jgi:hypothetical protein
MMALLRCKMRFPLHWTNLLYNAFIYKLLIRVMITGKKITNCPLTTQVNLKAGKEVSTKITSQLMKKMPTNLL